MSEIPIIKLAFCISGDEFDLNEVTYKIGVRPTETRTKDSFPVPDYAHTNWCFELSEERCRAVSTLFERMMSVLNGKENAIREVCGAHGLDTFFVIIIHMVNTDSPEIVLPKEAVAFAASINAEIGFDIYGYDSMDDDEEWANT